jgi:beta-lactamase regulating signal transducer with metallopeptidase domain
MYLFHPSELAALLSSEFSVRFTQSLLHFLWQGLVVGLLVGMVDRLSRRASSDVRYAVGVAALLVMLGSMPATYVVLGFFPSDAAANAAGDVTAPADHAQAESTVGATISATPADASGVGVRPVSDVDQAAAASARQPRPSWTWQMLQSLSAWCAPYATVTYLLGVAIMLARLGLALRSGHVLRQSAATLTDPAILAMAARQARRLRLKVVPAIAWCQRAAVPLVVGIVKPVILLPTAIASGLAPDQLESLLAHELAHLKRLDLLVNLVQRLAESLLFFHPAVWYVSRRISIERENCCDDCVLAAGWGRVEYADALVRMAEVCATARGLAGLEGAATLAASGEGPSQFKRRVLRLLAAEDHLRLGLSRGWLLAAVGAVLLAITAVPLASRWKTEVKAGQDEAPAEAKSSGQDGARRALQAARLERRQYLDSTFPNEERLIKSEVFVAEQKRSKAQESLERARQLAAKGFIAPVQLEAAEVALSQAQAEATKAQARLDVLQKFKKAKTLTELDRKVVEAIEALLDQRVAWKASDQPLIFVLDELEKAHEIPVTIDLKEVRARGASPQTRVTIDVVDKPLREVFKAVLSSAELDFEVTVNGIHVPATVKRERDAPQGAATPVSEAGSMARIRVKYDIPGAEEEGKIFVQHIGGRDIIGTDGDKHLPTNPVKSGQTLELKDLDPGDYQVARHRLIRLGELGMSRFLDRQRFKLESGETKSIDFTRPQGQPVSGTVLGLEEAGLTAAVVNVCSENAKDDRSVSDLDVTLFDSRLCAADGKFKTDPLRQGKYTIVVEGYLPLTPEQRVQSGIIRPRFVGTAKLMVPAKGEPSPVEVRLEDTEKRADANVVATASLVIHYDLPGAEERGRFLVEGPQGSIGPETVGLLKVNYVKNGQKLEMASLPPGDYHVSRYRTLMLDESFGLNRFLDGRQFKLGEREMRALEFKRLNGRAVAGKILGLEGKGINKVLLNVCSPDVERLQTLGRPETTIFDALLCNDDGTFRTGPLEPGRYTIVAEAYLPLTPFEKASTGVITPRYVGVAKITVPESGETPAVEVKLEDARKEAADAADREQAWGDLTVQFAYDGPRPEPKMIQNTRDVGFFGREIPDLSLLVGDKGGLANVAVYVTSRELPIHPDERKRAEQPAEIKVVKGNYQPRIVPLTVSQTLKLINDLPVHLNFKCIGQVNGGFNRIVVSQTSFDARLDKAERLPIPLSDSVHPFLQAYVLSLAHPYAAVSSEDGIARLTNLPEGEWTFRFWHEKGGYLKSAETGQREFKIKIKPGANRLALRVTPEFTVKIDDSKQPADAPPEKPDVSRGPGPQPDAQVRKAIEQPGVAIIADKEGRIVDVAVGAPASDELLEQLALLSQLKKLHIETTHQLTARGFENLAATPALEALGLYEVILPQGSLASLARFANLKELSINECGLGDGDLEALSGLTKLRSLSLRGNAITDAGLAHVVKLTELEELDLGNSSSVGSQMQISDDGLMRLTALKKLKQLNLSSTRLPLGYSDQGLAVLPGFRELETLNLSGDGLSDAALAHIGRCAQLRSLGLHFGGFTDKGMADVGRLKRLERISISSGDLTEAGLLHLGSLPKLEFAELRTDGVSDRVLESLSRIPSLVRLDLYANSRPGVSQSAPPFTGAGLAHFKGHEGLRTLWLTNVEIDPGMLASLKELTQLGELTMMMPGLNDDEVRALQIALPKTRVSAMWGGHGIAPVQDLPRPRSTKRSEGK